MWWMLLASSAQADSHLWARSIQRLELHNAAGDLHVERGGERIEVRFYPVVDDGCDVSIGERQDRAQVRVSDLILRTRSEDLIGAAGVVLGPGCDSARHRSPQDG